jgi:hypothetical protein
MAKAQRRFEVIQGGTGGETTRYSVDTGVVDEHGSRIIREGGPPSDGGGGGVISLFKLDVHRDVQIAKWGLAGLLVVFLYCFLYFNGELKEVRHDIADVNANVAGQTSAINGISAAVGRIEDRLDGQPPHKEAPNGNAKPKG